MSGERVSSDDERIRYARTPGHQLVGLTRGAERLDVIVDPLVPPGTVYLVRPDLLEYHVRLPLRWWERALRWVAARLGHEGARAQEQLEHLMASATNIGPPEA